MESQEIRRRFLEFFKNRGHAVIPSASLVPENDPSVLFTTAGMQPLTPYLLGTPHPSGKRLVNVQKCVRTQDIDEVGDNTHDTFFEMLGNWSLGDYFKKEAIEWSYKFLTDEKEGLGLDPKRLYVTVFGGNEDAPKDEESHKAWRSLGVPENHIYWMDGEFAQKNWWAPGDNGPCGPDTEMFYDVAGNLNLGSREEFFVADTKQQVVEIWNDVFMEYEKRGGKVVGKLKSKNVDTGAGLERLAMVMQGKDNIFDTDLFSLAIKKINYFTNSSDTRSKRIVADHARTIIFLVSDGVVPSNTEQGYILRRLLRRAFRRLSILNVEEKHLVDVASTLVDSYADFYPEPKSKIQYIISVIDEEKKRFQKPLNWARIYKVDLGAAKDGFIKKIKDIPIINKNNSASGVYMYQNFQTYGVPIDLSVEIARELGFEVDEKEIGAAFLEHQTKSRVGAGQRFKGGLADTSEMSVKYHTATHLLHQALRKVLGPTVFQKGSNITPERLRFDFSFERKMTDEEKKKVEELVNEQVGKELAVTYEDIPLEEARKHGAIGLFEEKYGDKVRVYKIGDFSLEFCGGPHVSNTKDLGKFSITKEEAVAQGVRRIKAVLS